MDKVKRGKTNEWWRKLEKKVKEVWRTKMATKSGRKKNLEEKEGQEGQEGRKNVEKSVVKKRTDDEKGK